MSHSVKYIAYKRNVLESVLFMKEFRKAFFLGILASLFFAFTFVFNRRMNLSGGYWLWSACLRYVFTLPVMYLLLIKDNKAKPVMSAIKADVKSWFLWSTVGFGLFYMPLTLASVYGESWFVAASWQITIVAGVLLTPLFGKRIPVKSLLCSCVIIVGVFLIQAVHFGSADINGSLLALICILIGAFSYPLGNRKMMQYCPEELSTSQRVFGMTLCSMPFWLVLSVIAFTIAGAPSSGQAIQSFVVALFSGVIATLLFFEATNLVKNNAKHLAFIEATQCGEVIFTLIGGVLILGDNAPDAVGFIGIAILVIGMIANSLVSAK